MTQLTFRTPAVVGHSVFDKLFDQFFDNPASMIKQSTVGYPITDLYKDEDDNQIIEMALAGFSKEDIAIEVKENKITISHQSTLTSTSTSRRIARRSFSKTFVDYNNQLNLADSTATFENGLLEIKIPQNQEAKPKTITIK